MNMLNSDQKIDFMINLLPLIPPMIKGIQEAVDLYEKTVAALKNGVTVEEMNTALGERDAVLQRVIDKTA